MRDTPPSWPLAVGALLSALLHAGVAVVLAWSPSAGGVGSEPPEARLPQDERLRPGIQDSPAATINWIGYAEYERHLARRSEIDQAAMSRGPTADPTPRSGASGQAATSPRPAPPPGAGAPTSEPAPQRAAQAAAVLAAAAREAADIAEAARTALRKRIAQAAAEALRTEARRDSEATPSPAEAPPNEASEPAEGPTADDPAPSDADEPGAPGGGRKEAPPTSRDEPIEVDPGEPLAVEGLDIETVAPRFSRLTEVTAWPRDALAEVHFDRAGRVRRAELLRSTGYRDVDRPLLDALYRWRAEGERLEELPPSGPGSTVSLVFRIRLR